MVDLARKILLHDKTRFLITVSGVAFAVTLVFVQVGLFEGLLANASVTIERIDADLWVTARNTPERRLLEHLPRDLRPARPLDPRRGAGRQPDRLVRPRRAADRRQRERGHLRPRGLRPAGGCPGGSTSGDPRDLRRGKYVILDDSATEAVRRVRGGRLSRGLRPAAQDHRADREARSFTTNPIAFVDYRVAQSMYRQELHNRTTYILVKLAPGADAEAVQAEIRRRLPYNDVRTRAEWAARSRVYWTDSTGLGPEHDHDGIPRLPGRRGRRGADALHLDDGAYQGVRDRQGDRRPDTRTFSRSSASRRRSQGVGFPLGAADGHGASARDGGNRPEADPHAGLRRSRSSAARWSSAWGPRSSRSARSPRSTRRWSSAGMNRFVRQSVLRLVPRPRATTRTVRPESGRNRFHGCPGSMRRDQGVPRGFGDGHRLKGASLASNGARSSPWRGHRGRGRRPS